MSDEEIAIADDITLPYKNIDIELIYKHDALNIFIARSGLVKSSYVKKYVPLRIINWCCDNYIMIYESLIVIQPTTKFAKELIVKIIKYEEYEHSIDDGPSPITAALQRCDKYNVWTFKQIFHFNSMSIYEVESLRYSLPRIHKSENVDLFRTNMLCAIDSFYNYTFVSASTYSNEEAQSWLERRSYPPIDSYSWFGKKCIIPMSEAICSTCDDELINYFNKLYPCS